MKDTAREAIYAAFRTLPILSNRHLLPLFCDHGSPEKRVSEALKELESEKLIVGRRQGDMTRVWRPTARGKLTMEIQRKSISTNSSKLQHYLAIADAYVILRDSGKLRYFQVEPREPFEHLAKPRIYAPDALFVYDRAIYLLEVQLSRLSRKQWLEKWRVANTYFNDGHYRQASWQRWKKADYIKPHIIALSPQDPDIVREGYNVMGRELKVCTDLSTIL